LRWYADDSDLRTIKDVHVPNIVMFGGIAVARENEKLIRDAIERAKSQFAHKRSPIKWNFKDLRKKYNEQNQIEIYNSLIGSMFDVRKAIFDAASEIDFTIIISLVQGYSSDKKVLMDLKNDLARYVFTNSLMRYSMHVGEIQAERAEVILDWPDGGNSKPYDVEYACAYNYGKTKDGVSYHSGELEKLNFNDSAVYTRMPHSTLMQFSDLVLGATREMVHHAIEPEKSGHGVKLLGSIADKFRGYPNYVIGRGISVNSQAADFKKRIREKFDELYINS
jgi:hypothetical protein